VNIQVNETPADCVAVTAKLTAESLKRAIAANGVATFVIAGGTLPPAVLTELSGEAGQEIDWTKVRFVIGDERICGWDEPDSSWRSAMEFFDAHPEIPVENKLRPRTESNAETAADAYEAVMKDLAGSGAAPRLDTIWLGMGEDGHTLSLFPEHPSLTPTDRLVIPVHNSPKPPADRISFTLNAFAAAGDAYILAAGTGKADVLVDATKPDSMLPIAQVARAIEAAGGTVTWVLDEAAAANLQ